MSLKKNFYLSLLLLLSLPGALSCSPVMDRPNTAPHVRVVRNPSCPLEFPNANVCGELTPLQNPTLVVKANRFSLVFWKQGLQNSAANSIDPRFSIEVIPWMKMPDGKEHGTSRNVIVVPTHHSDGSFDFELKDVRFTMLGLWQMKVKLKQNGVLVDEAIDEIEI